jgi:hypothetical protein
MRFALLASQRPKCIPDLWLKLLEKERKIEEKAQELLEGPKRKTKAKKKKVP